MGRAVERVGGRGKGMANTLAPGPSQDPVVQAIDKLAIQLREYERERRHVEQEHFDSIKDSLHDILMETMRGNRNQRKGKNDGKG